MTQSDIIHAIISQMPRPMAPGEKYASLDVKNEDLTSHVHR